MILAAYGDSLYKVLFLGHMLSFVVAFAPAVINPILVGEDEGATATSARSRRLAGHMASNGRQIHFPALIALGGFGIAMVLTSDPAFGLRPDLGVAGLPRLAGDHRGGLRRGAPGERKLAAGDLAAEKKVAMGGQIVTVLTLVMLYLMIWKPGA